MVYEIIPSTDPRLGRHIEHDPQSKRFAYKAPATLVLVSVRHHRFIPTLNQGSLGSCTGNAALGAVGSHPHYPLLDTVVSDWSQEQAVSIYSEATVIDEFSGAYPPTDTGSSGLAVAKILHGRGWISGYRHTFNLEDMKAALQETPVLLGINWYNNFFYPESDGTITVSDSDYVAGGHEVVVDEIDMERSRFGFTNSWGTAWGDNGRGYISFALMQRLLNERGDVVVPVAITEPAPEPDPDVEVEEPDFPVAPTPTPSGCLPAFLSLPIRLIKGHLT